VEELALERVEDARVRNRDADHVAVGTHRVPPVPMAGTRVELDLGRLGPAPMRAAVDAARLRHYSRCTEAAYVAWIRRYIFFHGKRHRAELGATEVTRFLSSLAIDGRVGASTQNQALGALLFLYRDVLELDLPWLDGIVRAKRPERLPVVLTREEVAAVPRPLTGVPRLMASLLYGPGLRLLECCRLRIQDIDFGRNQIVVRGGKGDKDRVTMLPAVARQRSRARSTRSSDHEFKPRRPPGAMRRDRRRARLRAVAC